jgi:hypothetical protein
MSTPSYRSLLAVACVAASVLGITTTVAAPLPKTTSRALAPLPYVARDEVVQFRWDGRGKAWTAIAVHTSGRVTLDGLPVARVSRRRVAALERAREAASRRRSAARLCSLQILYDGSADGQGLLWREPRCSQGVISVAFNRCPPLPAYPPEDPIDCRVDPPAAVRLLLRRARATAASVLSCWYEVPGWRRRCPDGAMPEPGVPPLW